MVHYDMSMDTDSYLHRSGRAGRFETNGLVISFISTDEDKKVLESIQDRFAIKMTEVKTV